MLSNSSCVTKEGHRRSRDTDNPGTQTIQGHRQSRDTTILPTFRNLCLFQSVKCWNETIEWLQKRANKDNLGSQMLMKLISAMGRPSLLPISLWKLHWTGTTTLTAKVSLLPCAYMTQRWGQRSPNSQRGWSQEGYTSKKIVAAQPWCEKVYGTVYTSARLEATRHSWSTNKAVQPSTLSFRWNLDSKSYDAIRKKFCVVNRNFFVYLMLF